MSSVAISIPRTDAFRVTVREDLRPDRGGTAFFDIGEHVSFLLDVDRLLELRDAMTAALDEAKARAAAASTTGGTS